MEINRGESKKAELGDRLANEEVGALPVGPNGGNPSLVQPPSPAPHAIPENFVCLRGPCVHYLEIRSTAEVEAHVDWKPIQVNRFCRAIPGIEIDLTEDCVYTCSDWDPRDEYEEMRKLDRRAQWLKNNPACTEADRERERAREAFYASVEVTEEKKA